MKTYELVITEKQPTCGGKSPTKSEIRTVTTDDPVAYVKGTDPTSELEVTEDGDTVTVRTDHNGQWVVYEFTED